MSKKAFARELGTSGGDAARTMRRVMEGFGEKISPETPSALE
jgi:hypothetical protein